MKMAECLMEGRGVPSDRETALRILILLADYGMLEAQDALRSMTDYDLAECDGDDLRASDFPEDSWGKEIMGRIESVG